MLNNHETILSEVFCDVLMRYAFMFGEECEKENFLPDNPDCLHVNIAYNGHKKGNIGIIAPIELCIEMASNVLGTDEEDENCVNDAKDTLEELANVVCGQFLTSAYGDEPIFNLSPPSVFESDELTWIEIRESDNSLAFMVEDAAVLIYLETE
ncbi:MAG: chemotaxis protein CheX [Candidatus Poribacteria bacterium]